MQKLLLIFALVSSVFTSQLAAEESTPKTAPTAPAQSDTRLPGVSLAEGISQITGTAVSPLLGMSAVGAWKYFNTPTEKRHLLPWYCNHWVWGSCTVILGLCFLKDLFGTAAPPLVKKPLDFAELFEDKASALVASGAFVPLIASAMAQANASDPVSTMATPAELGFAALPSLAILGGFWGSFAILLPVCVLAFLAVWLACHSINVIIAISPFGLVDAGLKLFKAGLLGIITIAALISPILGALVCLPLIVIAVFISGWTFRLMVFGNILGLDVLFNRKADPADMTRGVRGFNLRSVEGAPIRSYGKLRKNAEGILVFSQRPWLILPLREVNLDGIHDGIEKGILYPSLTTRVEDGSTRAGFLLLPRYRSCVPLVGDTLGISKITDSKLIQGVKAIRQWFVGIFNNSRAYLGATLERAR